MMAKSRWTDITSYSRGDKVLIPKTWEQAILASTHLNRDDLRVVVTRVHGVAGNWKVVCDVLGIDLWLSTDDVKIAQKRAVAAVQRKAGQLAKMAEKLR